MTVDENKIHSLVFMKKKSTLNKDDPGIHVWFFSKSSEFAIPLFEWLKIKMKL